jgi:glycosyltransferase involved in cell wall biosynthesis
VEAMASGTPVLTSNTTSLPEIGGNAVLTTDPYSIDGLAHELERIVTDSELRATLRTRGLERAKLFSWESTANRVKEVLAKASSPTGN